MTESESVALPLGDTPILSFALAAIARYIIMYKLKKNKHFYKLFAIFIFLLQCIAKRFIPEHVTTAPPAIAGGAVVL